MERPARDLGSQHLERPLPFRRRKSALQLLQIPLGEVKVERGTIVANMLDFSRTRNRDRAFGPEHSGQRNPGSSHLMASGDRAYRAMFEQAPLLYR
jgi:hypothetical protein